MTQPFKEAVEGAVSDRLRSCSNGKGKRTVGLLPPRARQDHLGQLRHGPQRGGPEEGARARFRRCAKSSGTTSRVLGSQRRAQPVPREGGPRGRLPRVRRTAVPRRAGPQGILRRPLPRGVPDARRRGAARRRPLTAYVAAWEYRGARSAPSLAQGAADVRERASSRRGATSNA